MSNNTKLTLYVNETPATTPSFLSREAVDLMNSIAWLSMDATWLFGYPKVGLWFGIPSIITGLLFLYVERHRPINYVYLSTNCWIWMNVTWMVSDTFPHYEASALTIAKSFLLLGLVFVLMGAAKSGGLTQVLAQYKGYKFFRLTKSKKVRSVGSDEQ